MNDRNETAEVVGKLLDSAPDAIVVVEAAGRIALVNLQTERMFGWSRDELLGREIEVLIPERFRPAHGGHVTRFVSTPTVRPMGETWSSTGSTGTGESSRSRSA